MQKPDKLNMMQKSDKLNMMQKFDKLISRVRIDLFILIYKYRYETTNMFKYDS